MLFLFDAPNYKKMMRQLILHKWGSLGLRVFYYTVYNVIFMTTFIFGRFSLHMAYGGSLTQIFTHGPHYCLVMRVWPEQLLVSLPRPFLWSGHSWLAGGASLWNPSHRVVSMWKQWATVRQTAAEGRRCTRCRIDAHTTKSAGYSFYLHFVFWGAVFYCFSLFWLDYSFLTLDERIFRNN